MCLVVVLAHFVVSNPILVGLFKVLESHCSVVDDRGLD